MFGNILRRVTALPVGAKIALAVAALVVLGLLVALSPLVVVLATFVLIVAVIALLIQLLRRASFRRWGIVAVASLLLVLVFSGISNALYGGGQPEQATSPERTEQQQEPAQPEKTKGLLPEPAAEQTREEPDQPPPAAKQDDEEDAAASQPRIKRQPSQQPEQQPPPPTPSPEDKLEDLGKVVTVSRVVDGDTIEVSPAVGGIPDMRLIGMDTPETYGGTEPYGEKASAFTTQRLEGRKVALEFDAERIDPYTRVLAYVWLPDGTMFNEVLVREGYAQVATFPPNVKYTDRFLAAQRQARAEDAGLWGLSRSQQCELANRGNGIGEGSPGCGGSAPREQAPAPSFRDRDCADFDSQPEAQEVLEDDPSDPNGLDGDSDGEACEELPGGGSSASATSSASASASASAAPRGGGGGGGGAPASVPSGGDIDCDQVNGPVRVPPGDPHGLDGDGDGWGCE